MKWIWQQPNWPDFIWETEALLPFSQQSSIRARETFR